MHPIGKLEMLDREMALFITKSPEGFQDNRAGEDITGISNRIWHNKSTTLVVKILNNWVHIFAKVIDCKNAACSISLLRFLIDNITFD